jgi:hypothetical protein
VTAKVTLPISTSQISFACANEVVSLPLPVNSLICFREGWSFWGGLFWRGAGVVKLTSACEGVGRVAPRLCDDNYNAALTTIKITH